MTFSWRDEMTIDDVINNLVRMMSEKCESSDGDEDGIFSLGYAVYNLIATKDIMDYNPDIDVDELPTFEVISTCPYCNKCVEDKHNYSLSHNGTITYFHEDCIRNRIKGNN